MAYFVYIELSHGFARLLNLVALKNSLLYDIINVPTLISYVIGKTLVSSIINEH